MTQTKTETLKFIQNAKANFSLVKNWFNHQTEIKDALVRTQLVVEKGNWTLGMMKIDLESFFVLVRSGFSLFTGQYSELAFERKTLANKRDYLANGNNQYLSSHGIRSGVIFLDGIKLLPKSSNLIQDDYVFFHEVAHLLQLKQKKMLLNIDSTLINVFDQLYHQVENRKHTIIIDHFRNQMLENFSDLLGLYLLQKKHQFERSTFTDLVYQVIDFRQSNQKKDPAHNTSGALYMALANGYFDKAFDTIFEATYRVSLASVYHEFHQSLLKDEVLTNSVKKILINLKNEQKDQKLGVDIVNFSNQFFFKERDEKINTFNNYNRLIAQKKFVDFIELLEINQHQLLDLDKHILLNETQNFNSLKI